MSAPRPWAWPLVPLYWAGLRTKDALRHAGALPTRRLNSPVISVGSLSAGGAGKTPAVIALTQLLQSAGWQPDVLSRGYGRSTRVTAQVDPALPDAAARFGDEPVLIARRTGAPVWVGAARWAAGRAVERSSPPEPYRIHLLDDGFQHRQLARHIDVVVLTADDLGDALLPAGNLREPLTALRRAAAILVRQEEGAQVEPHLRNLIAADIPVWRIRRRIQLDSPLKAGAGVVAFCGIARPPGFFAMLREAGVAIAREVTFPDHHRYTLGDVRGLAETCHLESCGGFVTTEKDRVKLGAEWMGVLEAAAPVRVARLETEFADPGQVIEQLERALGARVR